MCVQSLFVFPPKEPIDSDGKFGKQIQKKQLEIPEYASSFVDYKALKKLIKELKNSPVPRPQGTLQHGAHPDSPQSVLQANKAPFFFRLDRELDKVNVFYQVKEAESKVRLRVLMDKQKSTRLRNPVISKTSSQYATLEQGFRDFIKDLGKLQQFIEINATAFSKILKKWDKTSKSQTKELYLSRAVEVQPCFNRDVISELSDQAASSLLDCAAWAEGDGTHYASSMPDSQLQPTPRLDQDETDMDLMDALNRSDVDAVSNIIKHVAASPNANERLTKAFIGAVSQASDDAIKLLLETKMVDVHRKDEINDRNCLHKAAMVGRWFLIKVGISAGVDPAEVDAFGRIPLHYACMNGHVDIISDLIQSQPQTTNMQDLDNFSALIHAVVHGNLKCVETILSFSARIDPSQESDHIPLNLACQYGSVPIVQLLLKGHPKIMPDAEGLYPQHVVARFGRDPELLLLLRDYGADLDQPDNLYQWTPLFHAASEGRVECLRMLLKCGANPDVMDEKNLPALYYATWEGHLQCMATLSQVTKRSTGRLPNSVVGLPQVSTDGYRSTGGEVEIIPDLSLPPPIIPTRRYGHNFLETKTTVVISFEDTKSSVWFYDESKYPAARLTISPRSSDILPRNLLLPIQDESKSVSFEMDRLELFSVDFDVFPTFGKKVIAKGSVPSEVFRDKQHSSGYYYLSLLDPRLRSVGQICFKYNVIKPFSGVPLDITPFATYWKATSQLDEKPSALITGSSLSGNYLRLYVQQTLDGVPIMYPKWSISQEGLDHAVLGLSFAQFKNLGTTTNTADRLASEVANCDGLPALHALLADSYASLQDALSALPPQVQVELHVLFPTREEESRLRLGPTPNINDFVDALLKVVFNHARHFRGEHDNTMRSIVFTSYNKDLCTALNWKQPNYPVLLCNDLWSSCHTKSTDVNAFVSTGTSASPPPTEQTPKAVPREITNPTLKPIMSIREAVRIAQSNNFMGLVCRSQLLSMAPSLIESIKVAGLVLVSDSSDLVDNNSEVLPPSFTSVMEGIDGVRAGGVLRFKETIDV